MYILLACDKGSFLGFAVFLKTTFAKKTVTNVNLQYRQLIDPDIENLEINEK